MYRKSYVSVKAMLILALAVILIIGVVLGTQLILPSFATGPICVAAQGKHIDEMNRITDEVKRTGITQSNVPFKVEYCTEWVCYDSDEDKLAVNYTSNPKELIYYDVSLPWLGVSCSLPVPVLTKGKTCIFKISVSRNVELISGSC